MEFPVVHINLFGYALGFALLMPVIPYLIESLGADPVFFGYFQTFFQLIQLIGSPLLGYIGDVWGSKAAMMLSYSASTLSYLLTGMATSVPMLFISRVPSLFQHGLLATQCYVTEHTPTEHRAKQLGRLSLIYGVGFLLGPSIGGFLASRYSYSLVAYVASFGSLLSFLSVAFLMENNTTSANEMQNKSSTYSMAIINKVCTRPLVLPLLFIRFTYGISLAIFHATMPLIFKETYHLDVQQIGFVLSYTGVLVAAMQLSVGKISQTFSDIQILKGGVVIFCVAFWILLSVSSSLWMLLLTLIPLVTSGTILNTILAATLTRIVHKTETGTVLGLDMGVGTFCRVLSPTIGGLLFRSGGYLYSAAVSAIMSTVTLAFVYTVLQHHSHFRNPK